MITRLAKTEDIPGILALQEVNLVTRLSAQEKLQGFVTTPFTPSQLAQLLDSNGLFVIDVDGRIDGYTMAASWAFFAQWQIFPFMLSRLSGQGFCGTIISENNSFQYGPVCLDTRLRGSNAFPRLFEQMRIELLTRYPVGITFINKVNERSYHAHTKKLGMKVIDEFEFSGQFYYGLAFDTARAVIPSNA